MASAPTWKARSRDVERLSAAARSERDRQDRWPTTAPPGESPPELSGLDNENGVFSRTEYTLGWTSWEVVDSVEAPPPTAVPVDVDAPRGSAGPPMEPVVRRIGAVAVHSGDEALLAELHEHYSDRASFVIDTLWLLVLPERAEAPAPAP